MRELRVSIERVPRVLVHEAYRLEQVHELPASRGRCQREIFIDNLLVRIHCIIVMIR